MSLRFLSCLIIAGVLLSEGGVSLWQQWRRDTSQYPVFSWPQALETAGPDQPRLTGAMKLYQADRGVIKDWQGPDDTSLTAFYFEWDRLDAAPLIAIGGHAPEICNASAGFRWLGRSAPRIHSAAGDEPPLPFDTTAFAGPDGQRVYVFKLAWLQGFGAWELSSDTGRFNRLQKSFRRASGAGRVLQAGVFGARDEDHAWSIFQAQVLQQLQWRSGGGGGSAG